ncbi:MFS transporter, AGZA family, xanthine/uracil permease [Cladophialophora yegresii CBS 114405]|uniref:MFS transporter, AGZA family, xanthine/uracil permease n=1 Tax=Cladophialophora yegresii CBS 114405 TaxID=1182544 RepID=W9W8J7_9EURO|nr:MFS transporter, AGZA family, xanthine/uracil permease [Cladophialophora yegresii CBS 114405]EXJ64422.1 MFS transporter, AGZA family, xanthine/uracil permease [Cladophialophora yegresii CBS 114405]
MAATQQYTRAINEYVAKSTFGRVFRLQGCGHEKEILGTTFLTELRAGVTTFATMAYIIAVNGSIVSQSGGTCICESASDPTCLKDTDYARCVLDIQRDLITTTATISELASFVFGFLTNLPVALAPGMGLNAYFTYQVVGFHGTGPVSYRLALTAVFIEGFIFAFLFLIGMRQWLVGVISSSLKDRQHSRHRPLPHADRPVHVGGPRSHHGRAEHPSRARGLPSQVPRRVRRLSEP